MEDDFEYDFLLTECVDNIIDKVKNKEKIKGRKPGWMKDIIMVIEKSRKEDESTNVHQYLKEKLKNSHEIFEFKNKYINNPNTQKKFNKFKDLWKFRNIIQFHSKYLHCVDKCLLNRILQYKEVNKKNVVKNIVIKMMNNQSLENQEFNELNSYFESLYS